MAHFVKLTQASPTGYTEEDSRILFNLDTVISVEPVGDQTMIQTRWGRMTVSEDLDTILNLANADRGGFKAPPTRFVHANQRGVTLLVTHGRRPDLEILNKN